MRWRLVLAVAAVMAAAAGAWVLFSERSSTTPEVPTAAAGASPSSDAGRSSQPPSPLPQPRIQARPFGEDDLPPGEPAPVVAGELTVTVVDGDNHPVAGASVSPASTGGEPFDWSSWKLERTNREGTARVHLKNRYTHLVVTAASYPPLLVPIENRNVVRVALGGEIVLRGKVTVNGGVPPGPIALVVRCDEDPTDLWPEPAKTIVERHGFGEMRLLVETDSKGEFAARGPSPGTSVTLGIPEGYSFANPVRDAVRREAPAVCNGEPVVLDLIAMKAITGRVIVDPRSGGADLIEYSRDIQIRYTLARSSSPPIAGSLQAWMGERFAIYFDAPFIDGVDIQVWSRLRRPYGRKLLQERITGSKDLGDIVLEQLPWVRFRVGDPSGRPIENARVFVEGFVSEPTDSEGRTANDVPKGASSAIAGAPRFKLARVPLPEKLPEVVDIRLERSVTLVVRVRHEDPSADLRGLRVGLTFDVDEAVVASTARYEFEDARGAVSVGWGGSGTHQTRTYAITAGQELAVSGFTAGETVEVRVEDVYHHVLLREAIKLAETDVHPIEMVVRSKPQTVRGTVLDHQGKPLGGAQVGVVGFLESRWSPKTDQSGQFEIDGIYDLNPSVQATAAGHVERTLAVEKSGEPVTIQLEKARHLVVTLTGPVKAPPTKLVTFATPGGETYHASARGERLFWFEAIPYKPGVLRVESANGQATSTPVGPEDSRATAPVPD